MTTCDRPMFGDTNAALHCVREAGHDGGHVCETGSFVESLRHEDDGGS